MKNVAGGEGRASFGRPTAETVVELLLRGFAGDNEPTPAEVEQLVDEFLSGPFGQLVSERESIVREVLQRIRVRIGHASTLDDDGGDHLEWLPGADRSGWRFWPRLESYLVRAERLPPAVMKELDRSTDRTLERLENPERPGMWDRRGLVVGHVQSGKTTHYTGLVAKALDTGYQIAIILAGVHNSLRSQTHERIDRHLIGRDSAALLEAVRSLGTANVSTGLIGVGKDDVQLGLPPLPFTILTCTTSADDGDFRTHVANQVGFQVSIGSRLVMVVKKNATILRNLISWIRAQNAAPGEGRRIPAPTLIIDDESDHASINTSRDPDEDPTTINRLIRKLIVSFDRVAFVGYTATPFANVFISVESAHDEYGPDLFPRSFIVNLKAPSDYVGPALVFGHPGDESAGVAEQLPLPMHVPVTDASEWMPDKHKKSHVPPRLPQSLREAIRLFIVVCAARAARGDESVHNSMLVHATRFVDVQGRVAEQIEDELASIQNLVGLGAGSNVRQAIGELESVWRLRIVATYSGFAERLGDRCPALPSWADVRRHLDSAAGKVRVMKVNGDSSDALSYSRSPKGISVIVVGGDKLSRGLTLEGLSVSYFLRASNMFDTLMQMGRWFGYRPGYAEFCRVYTTPHLYSAFREIALAMDDLRSDLDRMAATGRTPQDFGLRVRTPSEGLLITAANKIRRGEPVMVRFAGELVQTLDIPRIGTRADGNRESVERFISGISGWSRAIRGKGSSHLIRAGVGVDDVLGLLASYEAVSTPCFYPRCEPLRNYIREQVSRNELTTWTIAVISKAGDGPRARIGNLEIPLVFRKCRESAPVDLFQTEVVVGLADEAIDLSKEEFDTALEKTTGDPGESGGKVTNPGRHQIRAARPVERGLLLIYLLQDGRSEAGAWIPALAASFPDTKNAKPLSYMVNEVWREQYGLMDEWSENAGPA